MAQRGVKQFLMGLEVGGQSVRLPEGSNVQSFRATASRLDKYYNKGTWHIFLSSMEDEIYSAVRTR